MKPMFISSHISDAMARSYPANTQVQKFLEESYNKERDTRLGWYFKTIKSGDAAGKDSKQLDVFRKKIEAACPKPSEGLLELKKLKPKSYHRRVINPEDNFVKPSHYRNAKLTVDMLPVEGIVRSKLYDGFTKEGKGRYQYLNERYEEIPESKYSFPLLSSWEYGWRLSDVIQKEEIKKPCAGRTRIVADTFYTRTGIPGLYKTGVHSSAY